MESERRTKAAGGGACIHHDENITVIIAPWRADGGHLLHVCTVAVSGRRDAISQTETAFCSQRAPGLAKSLSA